MAQAPMPYDVLLEAKRLRRLGKTYAEITEVVGYGSSTLSSYLRNIIPDREAPPKVTGSVSILKGTFAGMSGKIIEQADFRESSINIKSYLKVKISEVHTEWVLAMWCEKI